MTRKASIGSRRISLEAADWFTAMQAGRVAGRERAQFSEWLSQSAQHVQEYLQIAATWRDLGRTSTSNAEVNALLAAVKRESGESNVIAFDESHGSPTPRLTAVQSISRWHLGRAIAAAAVFALVAVATLFAVDRWAHGRSYTTEVGKQIAFSLTDGSVVRLNTQSQLRARMSASAREVELVRGEALFDVTRDPKRPFRVRAGVTLVEAVGTSFNVYRREDDVTVTVIEGKVLVANSRGSVRSQSGSVTGAALQAREQARVSEQGDIVKRSNVSLEPVTAWKDRRLVFEGVALGEIASEFNRYNREPIRIDDAELASLRISAVFAATDPASLVEFLERTEQVAVRRGDDGARVLYRRP